MQFLLAKSSETRSAAVMLVVAPFRIERHPLFRALPEEDRKYLKTAVVLFDAKAPSAQTFILPSGKVVLAIPGGERKSFSRRKVILAMRRGVSAAKTQGLPDVEIYASDLATPGLRVSAELAELLATQAELANFEFNRYREEPAAGWKFVKTLRLIVQPYREALAPALERGKIVGEEINKARSLSNTPGGDMTPQKLADAATEAGKKAGFSVKVLDEKKMAELGMGGVLGVARGSDEPPRFIVMEYWGGRRPRRPQGVGVPTVASGKTEKPVVLVGKGVTFDTGGLNVKPDEHMYEMHMDMSGGAAVIHTIAALARLSVKKNIVGLIPAVENMPSGSSYHPGDLLKTMSGKTIEVLNTDAEGRVILSDALTYAKTYNPRLLIDIATLTGAAHVALGSRASALFTNEPKLERVIREAGEATGDFVWPLPLWEEYEDDIKGTFGDWANTGKNRYGGAITAAVFLWQFVKDSPVTRDKRQATRNKAQPVPAWVHLDIAPRMTTIEGEYLAKGAAGASIALLVQFLRNK
jgi:leucyl aminopeptidase